MVNFTIKAFLICIDPSAGKKGSRKCWGWAEVEGKLYNYWGRLPDEGIGRPDNADTRKHLTFKFNSGRWGASDLQALTSKKIRDKGYRQVAVSQTSDGEYPSIESVYPNFVKSFKNQLMMAKLGDNIKNMGRLASGATA